MSDNIVGRANFTIHDKREEELSNAEIEQLDNNEDLIVDCVSSFLGVPCDYVDDNMNELVHDIADLISEWGEKHKNITTKTSYPYVESQERM